MRIIGQFENEKRAKKFLAFLTTEGIAAQLEQSSDVSEIWVKNEDQLNEAVEAMEAFNAEPDNPRYDHVLQEASKLDKQKVQQQRAVQKKIVNVGAGGLNRKPTLTMLLIGASILVALMTEFGDSLRTSPNVFKQLEFVAVPPPDSLEILGKYNHDYDNLNVRLASIKRGELWRLVTPIFIHHGTIHILFNMLWLFQLGKLIETVYGWKRLLVLVLATAAISNLVQCTVPLGLGGSAPTIRHEYLMTGLGGMSGVVYGLLGFVWMMSIFDRSAKIYLPQSTVTFMLGWMFFCMIPGATESLFGGMRVANWAHAIGLIVGMAIGYWPVLMQKHR